MLSLLKANWELWLRRRCHYIHDWCTHDSQGTDQTCRLHDAV